MAVSKRTRYEVLRRDNFTCRYCRSTESELTIDHVTPVALGGTDDPSNLVAACRDCNAGKTSTSPDAGTVADVADDAIRWAKARAQAATEMAAAYEDRQARLHPFLDSWEQWDARLSFLPGDFDTSVHRWLDSGLTSAQIDEALSIALSKPQVNSRGVWRYMCGIIRNWLADLDERTAALLTDCDPPDEFPTADETLVDFIDRYGRPSGWGVAA